MSSAFTGLTAGVYTVRLRDNNDDNCVANCDIILPEPSLLSCTLTPTPILCNGDATGGITVTAIGGTAAYEYSLNGAPWQPGNVFAGLTASTYSVDTRDANGCITTCDVTITQPPLLTCTTACLLYTSPSPRDATLSRMPSSA